MSYYIFSIALNQYKSSDYFNLYNSKLDVERLQKNLIENYGFIEIEPPLYDSQATRENVINTLNSLSQSVGKDDFLLIYYAGHGIINPETRLGYWIPYDGDGTISSFIPNSTILDLMYGLSVKHLLLISDSCFSGSFMNTFRNAEKLHYNKLLEKKSRYILTSGREEPVSDGTPGLGSPFANSLIDSLESHHQELLSITEVFADVSKKTGILSKQQPIIFPILNSGHEGGQFVFKRVNGALKAPSSGLATIKKFVLSVKTAEEIKQIGIIVDSLFCYTKNGDIKTTAQTSTNEIHCSALLFEEIAQQIPEFIEVDENTFIAKTRNYIPLSKKDYEDWFSYAANVHYQKTPGDELSYFAVCRSGSNMVAFSKSPEGTYNNLFFWGQNIAECAGKMLLALYRENKLHRITQ